MAKFKFIVSIAVALSMFASPVFAANSIKSAKGANGQTLIVSQSVDIPDNSDVVVTGSKYNVKVGIYVTFCVIPKKGKRPEICGPYDITGKNNDSVWVSSNPPFYAALLVTPFNNGGKFRVKVTVHRKIGDYDCKVVKCAILTRADHTRSDDRSADVIIPVTIK